MKEKLAPKWLWSVQGNRRSYTVLALIAIAMGAFLAIMTLHAGMFADDATLYRSFLTTDLPGKVQLFFNGIPGRNLQIVWLHLSYFFAVRTPGDFTLYHIVQSLFVGLNMWLLGALLLRLRVRLTIAALTMLLFGVWPVYSEVYFWPTLLVVHVIPTSLVLIMVHCLVWSWNQPEQWRPVLASLAAYLLAVFSYDQNVTSATFLMCVWLLASVARGKRNANWRGFRAKAACVSLITALTVVVFASILLWVRPGRSGYVVTGSPLPKIFEGLGTFVATTGITQGEPQVVNGGILVWFTYGLRVLLLLSVGVLVVRAFYTPRPSQSSVQVQGDSRRQLLLIGAFLCAAIAAYVPSWTWVVALRHNYLPMLLVSIAVGLSLEGLVEGLRGNLKKVMVVLVAATLAGTCSFSLLRLVDQARIWNARAELRQTVYQRVADLVAQEPNGRTKCVKFMAVDTSDYAVPFNNESMFDALNIYARDPYSQVACSGEWIPDETGCADGFFPRTDPSVTYIAFPYNPDGSRNWLAATVALKCA